nr:MAG TPA: hypothetical protein [Bacteriophage sp.]
MFFHRCSLFIKGAPRISMKESAVEFCCVDPRSTSKN